MSIITTPAQLDAVALTAAIISRDAQGVVAWYTDDAVVTVVNRDHPPSLPARFEGKSAVTTYFTEICGRHLEHEVHDLVQTPSGIAFTQDCRLSRTGRGCSAPPSRSSRRDGSADRRSSRPGIRPDGHWVLTGSPPV